MGAEKLQRYDLRMRSLDDGFTLCCHPGCTSSAIWSLWMHTPEWGDLGGETFVRCHPHGLDVLHRYAHRVAFPAEVNA